MTTLVQPEILLAAVVAPVFLLPAARALQMSYRSLVGTDTCWQAVRRWHHIFSWQQRLGIALSLFSGFGHLWLVLR